MSEWNPVGVKPPDRNEKYLITTQHGNIDIAYWSDTDVYGRSCGKYRWHTDLYQEVRAWMPLPKPYFQYEDMIEELEEYARNQGDAWDESVVQGAIQIIRDYVE